MDLSIIIVSWKVKDILKKNLENIYKSEGDFKYEVFVVDNDSQDGTGEMIEKNFSEVNFIANSSNLGFSKANNQAIKKSKGRYVLLLNPDMKVFPNTFQKMIVWMDSHPEAGIAGCRLLDKEGGIVKHVRRFPSFFDQAAIILKFPHLFPWVLNKYLFSNFDYSKEAKVDSIRGSFFMIRRKLIEEIGGLDERYFVWFEEVDYCRQTKEVGWKIYYTPSAECVDLVGQSFSQLKRGSAQKYFRDSMLKYFRKWHPAWQSWILRAIWPFGILIVRIVDFFKIKELK